VAKKSSKSKDRRDKKFPIVGIGASAGGLEAFEQFFTHLPPDTGLGFVLIPHLAPKHKSILGDLLKKYTDMEVLQVEEGMRVEPNHVYVIPPNKDMAILNGILQLMEPVAEHGLKHPIDYFFRSLAQDQQEMAVCIILSGTGSEGALGLKSIKEGGGVVMVQDVKSAKYDGMPRSAIATNLVDFVLPPEKMGEELVKYVEGKYFKTLKQPEKPLKKPVNDLRKILILLRNKTGHDFSQYKQNTIIRRIEKRMAIHQISKTSDYVRYLQKNPAELDLLFRELLIGVTNFFRDPDAFKVLQEKVIPLLLEGRSLDRVLRVWVPGCSTGEEAYSIAMVFRDVIGELKQNYRVQVFATEIDNNALEVARRGEFPESISVDVPIKYLRKFFTKEDNTYKIKNEIREMVVFAPQDVLRDPPFSKIDLLSSRNLLIYLGPELQKRLMRTFHYSLNSGGILFLGSSETIGGEAELFSIFNKKWKFYRRRAGISPPLALADFYGGGRITPAPDVEDTGEIEKPKYLDLEELTEKVLLESYAPPSVIINEKGDIHYIHGRTGKYLEPAPGKAHLSILEMAREGLRLELGAAIHKAVAKKREVVFKGLQIKTNGETKGINLKVTPIREPHALEGLLMVVFEDLPEHRRSTGVRKIRPSAKGDDQLKALERELKTVKENLKANVEEMEASNEELKSSNEELQSTNEELQSTNEELETSKEELQSVNEELVTVNTEHQEKIDQLTLANNDLNNLLTSTEIATIFLDKDLQIRRFTPKVTNVIKLIPHDVGRPVTDLSTKIRDIDLGKVSRDVLKNLGAVEKEVQNLDGNWYIMHVMPYRTTENIIDGVVITFTDVTEMKTSRETLEKLKAYSESIIATIREPLLIMDNELRVISASRSFYKTFKVKLEETEGKLIYELGNRQWDIPKLRKLLEKVLPENNVFEDYKVTHDFPGIGNRVMLLNARMILQSDKKPERILLAIEDITEHNQKR
jgi:two-component system CheB/CheR fusion protein